MGLLSKFEGKMEDTVEGAAGALSGSSISPVQICKHAEKQMKREKMVGAGKQYAPTLYTVLVSLDDDARMFNYYPTLAGEVETYLMARANEFGFAMDGQPLVRFIEDPELKRGKFDVVAEMVAAPIVAKLREEEMERYGISSPSARGVAGVAGAGAARGAASAASAGVAGVAGAGAAGATGVAGAAGVAGAGIEEEIPSTFDFDENVAQYGSPASGVPAAAAAAAPSPTPVQQPHSAFECYLYDEARDTAYALTGAHQHIGRESSNEISIPDINVSRVHAEIFRQPNGAWVISDLGSTNGLFVNGNKVQSMPLHDADMITVGTTTLEFQQLA